MLGCPSFPTSVLAPFLLCCFLLQSSKIHTCLSWWLPSRACTACTVQLQPFVGFGFAGCCFCSCVMKNTSLALTLPVVNMWPFEKVIFLFDSNFIKSKRRKCNRLREWFEEIAIGICLYFAGPENSRFLSAVFYCAICSYKTAIYS